MQAKIPHLTRSSLHRCLQRQGISRQPEVTGDREPKRKFTTDPIGYCHIDSGDAPTLVVGCRSGPWSVRCLYLPAGFGYRAHSR